MAPDPGDRGSSPDPPRPRSLHEPVPPSYPLRRRAGSAAAAAATVTVLTVAQAASSDFCAGGGFSLVLPGRTVTARAGPGPAHHDPGQRAGTSFLAKGKYVEFTVSSATLGVRDWTLTGAANPGDITGGKRTAVFASKTAGPARLDV